MGLSVSMPKGLTVLMGPTRAKVSQLQNIGGKIISSHQVTYTYILSASQAGTFTIPAASIIVKGEKLCSQPLALTVVPAKQSSSGCTPQPRLDAFITMTVSERSPRVNAPIVLECKLYTAALVDIEDMEQFISPDDFKVESIDSRNRPLRTEHLNGRSIIRGYSKNCYSIRSARENSISVTCAWRSVCGRLTKLSTRLMLSSTARTP